MLFNIWFLPLPLSNNIVSIVCNFQESVAEKLYTDMPDTSFTRTISNPEVVMRRRRQQKLEKKLQEIRSKDDKGKIKVCLVGFYWNNNPLKYSVT